jgi:DNA-binding transcriptional LysR family regulator
MRLSNDANGDHEETRNAGVKPGERKPPITHLQQISTSLKHWKMFHAVAECGSFATAADYLKVSQATISYSITRLEETLGVSLLRLDGRKYQLTIPGTELLKRSRFLLCEAVALEKFADALREGERPEIKLAIARDFPTRLLMPALRRFSSHWRHAKVGLIEVSTHEVERVLHNREADIAINTSVPSGFHGDWFIEMQYIAVASPDHPLFQLDRVLTPEDLNGHVQIVAQTECTPDAQEQKQQLHIRKHWYVSNFETAITALCEAIGYGWVPKHRIEELLKVGELKALPLEESSTYAQSFYLIRGRTSGFTADSEQLAQMLQGVATSAKRDQE